MFSQADLDTVLYGYFRRRHVTNDVIGHALTGLAADMRLSHGVDRILGCESSSTLQLPPGQGLELYQTTIAGFVHRGIRCCANHHVITGTRFGPFKGRLVGVTELKFTDDNSSMWELYDATAQLRHFIDGGRGTGSSWMSYVNCARCPVEQNLEMIQTEDGHVFYDVIKDINPNTELLVWYSDQCYEQFMGIPVSIQRTNYSTQSAERVDKFQSTQASEANGDGYQCHSCGKVFAYKYYRDKHLKYTRCIDHGDRKFPCQLCTRSFEKRDRLRIHVLHVHEKHQPHTCCVCNKRFSQSSSLNKHMRVHSGERPYKCVYCSKAFTASSILRTHIRQHSGEKPFKCRHCGRAFASHAAHDSHVRRTHQSHDAVHGHVTTFAVL